MIAYCLIDTCAVFVDLFIHWQAELTVVLFLQDVSKCVLISLFIEQKTNSFDAYEKHHLLLKQICDSSLFAPI